MITKESPNQPNTADAVYTLSSDVYGIAEEVTSGATSFIKHRYSSAITKSGRIHMSQPDATCELKSLDLLYGCACIASARFFLWKKLIAIHAAVRGTIIRSGMNTGLRLSKLF